MRKWRWLVLFSLLAITSILPGQTLRFSLPDTTIVPDEMVTLPIRVTHFDSIVSIQFSLKWNTEVLTYVDNQIADLENVAIGDFQADNGELRLSWFNQEGNSRSLPDGSSIIDLVFVAVGEVGDSTFLPIGDDPIPIQIAKATNVEGQFEMITPEQDIGLVRIGNELGIAVNKTNPTCPGDADGSIQLGGAVDTTALTASWTGPDGYEAIGFTLTGLSPGEYTVEISDTQGELLTSFSVTIDNLAPLSADIEQEDTQCNQPTGSISISPTGGTAPYTISLDGTISPDGVFTDLAEGDYQWIVTDANGCTTSDMIDILSPQSPSIDLGGTLFLCDSIRLMPEAMGIYQWSTGSTASSILVTETGTYSVTVTNNLNCTASDEVEILPGDQLMAFVENDFLEFCPGDTLVIQAGGAETYTWLNGADVLSATDVPDPLAFPDSSIVLQLLAQTSCAEDTLEVPLTVFEITATAGPDTCIAPGESLTLRATGGIFYEWEPALYPLSDRQIPNPTVTPEDSITYFVSITDINGCVTEDDIKVLVGNDPATSILAINLITPNGDGLNDVLEFKGADKFGSNSLKIYNRWGNLVYQKINYQLDDERFDGTYQEAELPAGNYFYVLAFRSGEIKQTLTIVRN